MITRSKFLIMAPILSKKTTSISSSVQTKKGEEERLTRQFTVGIKNTVLLFGDPVKPRFREGTSNLILSLV